MNKIDEAIKLLKEKGMWYNNQQHIIHEIISILKSEPEPWEFTKRLRLNISQPDNFTDALFGAMLKDDITVACDIIDRLTDELKAKDDLIEQLRKVIRENVPCVELPENNQSQGQALKGKSK